VKICLWGEYPDPKRIEVRKEIAASLLKKKQNGDLCFVRTARAPFKEGQAVPKTMEVWRNPSNDSLYEFAGKGEVYKVLKFEHSYDDLERGLSFWQVASNDDESKTPMSFYNVSTAASITGCVRAFLMRSIAKCSGVLYTDTDSLIARDVSGLEIGNELGQWKLEKTCDAVWIGGKKLYCAHASNAKEIEAKAAAESDEGKKQKLLKGIYKTASKGVRLSVPDLISVCEGEERSYSFDAPNYSPFSKPGFTTRKIVRADKRKTKSSHATSDESDRRTDTGGTASGGTASGGNQPAMPSVDLEQPVSNPEIPSATSRIDGRN
jgi:hypothetical protein